MWMLFVIVAQFSVTPSCFQSFHFKRCRIKVDLPCEELEETHELFSLHRVPPRWETLLCCSSGMLACDANRLCFRPGRNVWMLGNGGSSSSPGGCPSSEGESARPCSFYAHCNQIWVTCFNSSECWPGLALCFSNSASLIKENQHLMAGLVAVPHMPGLMAHQSWVLWAAAVMPGSVTAASLWGWCSAVLRPWQGCNWFVRLGSVFLQAPA